MILIFDYFETLLSNKSVVFNRGLKVFWEKNYFNILFVCTQKARIFLL